MESILGENRSYNKHRYTNLLFPVLHGGYVFSPYTHGSRKFVTDSECQF